MSRPAVANPTTPTTATAATGPVTHHPRRGIDRTSAGSRPTAATATGTTNSPP